MMGRSEPVSMLNWSATYNPFATYDLIFPVIYTIQILAEVAP